MIANCSSKEESVQWVFLSFNSINGVPLTRKDLAIVEARKNLSSSSPGHSEHQNIELVHIVNQLT